MFINSQTGLWLAGGGGALLPTYNTTWNPSDTATTDNAITLSNGNLTATLTSTESTQAGIRGTVSRSTGKWVIEQTITTAGSGISVGFATSSASLTDYPFFNPTGWACYSYSASVEGWTSDGTGDTFTAVASGDKLGFAIDIDAALLWVARNGTWLGLNGTSNPSAGTGGVSTYGEEIWFPVTQLQASSISTPVSVLNCGTSAFAFTMPTGFAAWNT